MSKKELQAKVDANEVIKTQIDASIGVARSVVESWLPPPKPGERVEEEEEEGESFTRYSTGRPDRLGLGAKFLSHKDATTHQQGSKQEIQLRNKILNQNQRAAAKYENNSTEKNKKRPRNDDDDDNDEESRTQVVSNRKPDAQPAAGDFLSTYLSERANKKKKKKKKNNKANAQSQQPAANDDAQ